MHFQLAADSGHPAAAKAKDWVMQLELRMSASGIAEAKQLAREFIEGKQK